MKIQELISEYDRRLSKARAQYDEEIQAAVNKWREAQKELDDWFDQSFDSQGVQKNNGHA